MEPKFCYYTPPFPRARSYRTMIDLAAEHGLFAVEGFCQFEFSTPDRNAARELKKYADARGVVFPCFSLFIDLVGEDAEARMEYLKGYAEVAAILDCPYLHHTVIPECTDPTAVLPRHDELFDKGVRAVREIYDYAAPLGVRTIYEDQGYIFNGVKGMTAMIDAVGRDIGVVADFGNITQADETIEAFIPAFADRIVHAHLKDVLITPENETGRSLKTIGGNYMLSVPVGEGSVHFQKGLSLLREIGYDGYFGLEFSAKADDSTAMHDAIRYFEAFMK